MRLLFLVSRFPYPPDRGDRLTVFHLLQAFSARHAVTLLSFVSGEEPAESMERVAPFCERVVTVRLSPASSWAQAWLGLASSVPAQVAYYRSPAMAEEVRRLLAGEGFDAIVAHAIRMAPFVRDLDHPIKIMFQGDSVGQVLGRSVRFAPWWKRPGILWERRRVDRYIAPSTRRFLETWVLSPGDQEDLMRLGCVRVELVPHGVDERLFQLEHRPAREVRIMFLGNLSVPHNIDAAVFAAREIFPAIRAEWPEARLVLAGADPAAAVRGLSAIEGVTVTGPLPDLQPLWQSAHVLLAPLRFSTGIQNKVLEAMAAGVPVVTTSSVAEALGASHGQHLLTAESAVSLAAAVAETLHDPAAASARARRAREHVRARFTWDLPVRRLEELVARGWQDRARDATLAERSSAGRAQGPSKASPA